LLVRDIRIELHDESIVRNEGSVRIEAMNLHPIDPPIDFAADALLATRLRRAATHAERFNAHDVVVVKHVERFIPRLFPSQFHYLLCHFFGIHS
jgi:hypothetical protein